MSEIKLPKYPLIWEKDNVFLKVFCSIPDLATGILLMLDKENFILDPGDGILRDLNSEIGSENIKTIQNIFISHGHHDHVGGIWSLLTYMYVMKKQSPLNIYFPKGTMEIKSIHKAFVEVYADDLKYKVNLIEIENEDEFSIGKLNVKPFKVRHFEHENSDDAFPIPAYGFKFDFNGITITYGGDSAYTENLVKYSKGADLAILEAGAGKEEKSDFHMTFKEAVNIGETAKEYFLVHVPQKYLNIK